MTSSAKAEGRFDKADFVYLAQDNAYRCPASERAIYRCRTTDKGLNVDMYWSSACPSCRLRTECTTGKNRRIRRWEHEDVLERVQHRLDRKPDAMTLRRCTVEHVFGTLKHWMGSTHFLTRTLAHVSTEMSLHVLAYNLKRDADAGGGRADRGDESGGGLSGFLRFKPRSTRSCTRLKRSHKNSSRPETQERQIAWQALRRSLGASIVYVSNSLGPKRSSTMTPIT